MAFKTCLLDEALARRRAIMERTRRAVLAELVRLLGEWGPRYGIRHAYIFGSITRPGHFTEDSDVDIAVERMVPEDYFLAMSAFASALGREVDLIELDRCHFAHRIRERGIKWTKEP